MVEKLAPNANGRYSFSKIKEVLEMPDLLEVQKKSYKWLLDTGIPEVLRDMSPITDSQDKFSIYFTDFRFDTSATKYSVEECKERDVNYAAPLYVTVQLKNNDTNEIAQKDVYMGDFPVMTESGTFVINGAERVIISQICRSPGAYYAMDYDKSGKKLYSSTVIPYRGAWLEYETGPDDIFSVHIDKNRKIPVTQLIRALGINTDDEIKEFFGTDPLIVTTVENDECTARAIKFNSTPSDEALKEIYSKLRPGEPPLVESAKNLLSMMFFDPKRYDLNPVGRYKYDKKLDIFYRVLGRKVTRDVYSPYTGDCVLESGSIITEEAVEAMEAAAINEVYIEIDDGEGELKVFGNGTVFPEKVLGYDLKESGVREKCRFSVLCEILQDAEGDIDEVKRLAATRIAELVPKHITKDDIFSSINYVVCLKHDIGNTDDIDHLGNRRLRCVGELLQNQLRIGFSRMEKIIKERMGVQDGDTITPESLVNIRPIVTATREFFGSSPLSQFMDQNNPLAELTHKRRLSALGPGGLSRDRASFDVRDVHYTHYGRMCPIETPEGQNIGLISYLATYAKISDYGFIMAPYRVIDKENGVVLEDTVYMTADIEDKYTIAQANEPLDSNGHFINQKVTARHKSEIIEVDNSVPDYMDVSPKMVVSVATACIPFLENDDNSRALMGSNMQKQAVPLLVNDSPIVGTGMERKAAMDSGVMIISDVEGYVESVSADEIVVVCTDGTKKTYRLTKFKRSNQSTCINQRPIVKVGELVRKGTVLADGPATCNGEISLGKNALIGFMTWEGYNYEDAVLLNENLVRNDVYTSIHIDEYSHEARDTKLGPEEITREIPNVGDDALKDLDEFGIVRIGTEVRSGDILVGKVTPKGETEQTAEERLLHAIFGEKAREVRDTSLRVPHGIEGIVIGVNVFSREHHDEMPTGVNKVVKVYIGQKRKISVGDKMAGRHGNKGVVSRILPPEDMPFMADGTPLDIVLNPMGVPSRMNIGQVLEVHLGIAARRLGMKVMTPVFDGAKESDITELFTKYPETGMYRDVLPNENLRGKAVYIEENVNGMKTYTPVGEEITSDKKKVRELIEAGMLKIIDCKTILYDGRTGDRFDSPVTVGVMYYLKLHHLVDDKIHARSTGPYSLVTQQPLGGKAQFGGQRFGEMEVWALEAYGAAYMLQEILTVKSDDTEGRAATYEAIIKGENVPTPGVPEAFRVLVKELQALCLDIRVLDHERNEVDLSLVEGASKPGENAARLSELFGNGENDYDFENEEDLDGFSIKDENGDDDFYHNEEEVFGNDFNDENEDYQ